MNSHTYTHIQPPSLQKLHQQHWAASLEDINIINTLAFQAEILTGKPVKSMEDAHAAIESLLQRGCQTVIITLGEQGSVYASQQNRVPTYVPARKVSQVDSTVRTVLCIAFSLIIYIIEEK